jgi:hypothetical protein
MLRRKTPPMAHRTAIAYYYLPFCPRPSIVVTRDTLAKLGAAQVDGPAMEDVKRKVMQNLVKNFGQPLVMPSPHLYAGVVARSLLSSTCLWLPLCCVDEVFGFLFFLVHNFTYVLVMTLVLSDEAALCSQFKALCGE